MRPLVGIVLRWVRGEDEDGQTLVEYGLLLALIAIVVVASLLVFGPIVSGFFGDFGDTVQDIT